MCGPKKLGVLDLQGGVDEHIEHFARLGISAVRVKHAHDFGRLAGLVLPGGESTCLARLLHIFALDNALIDAHHNGMKVWGTCAGVILLAAEIVGESAHLALVDVTVQRNAFGGQLDSFNTTARIPEVSLADIDLVFIRSPKIVRIGPDVRPLLTIDNYVASAESNSVLLTVFHPELTPSLAFHRHFAAKCGIATDAAPDAAREWTRTSWMQKPDASGSGRMPE